ncbi:hypothetical protein BHE74_00004195 [Ensete ventricosum]|nr:hypothetical protein BHE74_00004195 [Ensete ventricosum]
MSARVIVPATHGWLRLSSRVSKRCFLLLRASSSCHLQKQEERSDEKPRKGEEDLFQAVEELVGEVGEKSLLALFSSTGEHLVEITVQECGLEVIDQIVLHRRQIDRALADPVHTSLPLHAFFHGHRRMKAQCERSLTASPCQRTTHRTKCFL